MPCCPKKRTASALSLMRSRLESSSIFISWRSLRFCKLLPKKLGQYCNPLWGFCPLCKRLPDPRAFKRRLFGFKRGRKNGEN
jgi:hypothetical protein